jgi:hypothetical protein
MASGFPINLIGQRFGRLTVIEKAHSTPSGTAWLCKCDCGGERIAPTSRLKRTQNAGCKICETERRANVHLKHGSRRGGTRDKLYMIWKGMHSRCRDKGNTSYPHYGARGIGVSKEWSEFEPFKQWAMENGYSEGLSIERLCVFSNYSPKNCEWLTRSQNSKNVPIHGSKFRSFEDDSLYQRCVPVFDPSYADA